MNELQKIEEQEFRYLIQIQRIIKEKLEFILRCFSSRFKTYEYWASLIETEKKRLTDLGTGAERVFNHVIVSYKWKEWHPVPIPFGSNLFFETSDVFINIDVKTAYADNPRDFQGRVEVGEAQTSYPMKKKHGSFEEFQPKLKPFYEINDKKKYCLTYVIQVVHTKPEDIFQRNLDPNPVIINVISIPNGLLYEIYGEDIVKEPKSYHTKEGRRLRPANFRYYYCVEPHFKLLNIECGYRIRIFFNQKYRNKLYKDILLTPETTTQINPIPNHIITFF
jgi:hypothetical protein